MNEPATVIYHSADYDGIFCREIARKFLPDAKLLGWNFGEPNIPIPPEGKVYVLDLSPDCLHMPDGQLLQSVVDRIVWIDHHKTSIEKWPSFIPGYRIDGVAACRLAWQWFQFSRHHAVHTVDTLPGKHAFIERTVTEPLAVRLAGEYDIWDKRDPDAETFQYGLRVLDVALLFEVMLDADNKEEADDMTERVVEHGRIAQVHQQKTDASTVKARSFLLKWEGLTFLVLNSARFNSLTFAALDVPETGHDALMGFCFNGKEWCVSLYHAKHNTGIDLSEIAKKYKGGGHRGACGFQSAQISPILFPKSVEIQ